MVSSYVSKKKADLNVVLTKQQKENTSFCGLRLAAGREQTLMLSLLGSRGKKTVMLYSLFSKKKTELNFKNRP